MTFRITAFVLVAALGSSCNSSDEEPNSGTRSAPTTQKAPTTKPTQNMGTETPTQDQTASSTFYKVSIPKPAKMCDQEGYKYLFDAYFVKECGACHYENNTYGVTPFAAAANFTLSFTTMTTSTDTQIVREAIHGNAFCKQCKLEPNDPLAKDITFWLDHDTDCTGI
ncbi:MAG: hypothetical protein AB7T49_07925 [Oligoflexales bacterium]